ncbi:MAG: hypothetical protein ACI9X4_002617 [Glaciecola sp.]|jgi:hypothetical protein
MAAFYAIVGLGTLLQSDGIHGANVPDTVFTVFTNEPEVRDFGLALCAEGIRYVGVGC